MERLVFRYLTGSKANQIEQVPMEGVIELMIGRDPNAAIVFDPDKDDLVSRQHAVIRVTDNIKLAFSIADLQSTNGTFLNGERILAEQELLPGDTIEFGRGGPKMVFDVEPRPAHMVERTRIISNAAFKETKMSDGSGAPVTSVHATGASATTVGSGRTAVPPPKSGIGRETLERELSKERKASGQKWMIGAAAALLVIGVVGGILYYRNMQTEQALKEQLADAAKKAEANVAAVKSQVEGMTPKQIAAKYGDATVFIESSWNLYDKVNSKQVFHKFVGGHGELFIDENGKAHQLPLLPAFVMNEDGSLVRWLVTESEDLNNPAIGIASRGSGFVVTPDGSILTNKHVGAGWLMPWDPDFERGDSMGIAFPPNVVPFERKRVNNKIVVVLNPKAELIKVADMVAAGRLKQWVPGNPSLLFSVDSSAPLQRGAFEAKQDLTVTFPGTKLGVAGRFLRASQDNDASLIKIDVPGNTPLRTVEMAATGYSPPLGEPVTVIGYPALSGERYAVTKSRELMGSGESVVTLVPEPTVTEGIVSKVFETEAQGADSSGTKIVWYGDYYQLTINTSGPGNSGGPVFDSNGKVIGIYTYGLAGGRVSGAVPIKFAQELMHLSRVTDR